MTIKNFDAKATSLDGTPFKDGEREIFLKDAIADMLEGTYPDEAQSLSGIEKFKRAKLSLKMREGGDINFETEELAIIKEIVGKRGITPIVYQAFNILDGE